MVAAGPGPAWPQLSPLQPGTGKQNIFTFRWGLGLTRASKCPLCLWAGQGGPASRGGWEWVWGNPALDVGRDCPLGKAAEQPDVLLMLLLFQDTPSQSCPHTSPVQAQLRLVLLMAVPPSSSRLKGDFIPNRNALCLSFPFHNSVLVPFLECSEGF